MGDIHPILGNSILCRVIRTETASTRPVKLINEEFTKYFCKYYPNNEYTRYLYKYYPNDDTSINVNITMNI